MRVGEIVIISPTLNAERQFIQAICGRVETTTPGLTFGRLPINNQLLLHLYGITLHPEVELPAWDLIIKKALGCVVIFPWEEAGTFDKTKPIIDEVTIDHRSSIVVAAQVDAHQLPVASAVYRDGISLTSNGQFTFFDHNNPDSVKNVLLTLVNLLISQSH